MTEQEFKELLIRSGKTEAEAEDAMDDYFDGDTDEGWEAAFMRGFDCG
jgi:hypothetical protein